LLLSTASHDWATWYSIVRGIGASRVSLIQFRGGLSAPWRELEQWRASEFMGRSSRRHFIFIAVLRHARSEEMTLVRPHASRPTAR
jgi:hypothetical protein